MDSRADSRDPAASAARLLDRLRQCLESAGQLTDSVRQGMTRGDVAAIEQATARMETCVQEFKLLAEEYRRLDSLLPSPDHEPAVLTRARQEFEETLARQARSSAMTSGLLERLIAVSRGLLALLGGSRDAAYLPSGHSRQPAATGMRLRERA